MSDSEAESVSAEHEGPIVEVVYPLGEETEVPNTLASLFKTVITEGTSDTKPPRLAKVTVHYVGTLLNGEKFDSSRDRDEPFVFTIGQGQVIKGWDKGVATMNKGEKAILRCLPDYAYGANGSPPKIPGNSTLTFEVELLDWTKCEDISENRDMSIIKDTKQEGSGGDQPDYESCATIDVTATEWVADGTQESGKAGAEYFNKKGWQVVVGVDDLPCGLTQALKKMKRGERAVVVVKARVIDEEKKAISDKRIGSSELEELIPSGKPLRYEITLSEFSSVHTWNFKGMDKVIEGRKRKDDGNAFFAAANWTKAEAKYMKALEFVSNDYDLKSDDQKAEAKKLKVILLGNLAQVQLNTGRFSEALEQCNKALAEDGTNAKNLFRRAKALGALDEWEDGIKDLNQILELDPQNAPARAELVHIRGKQAAYEKKMKARYAGMFSKISDE
eukprot:GDKJ01023405.1.p1 GENE.GDKJ01023405.1~~GDKJ01023405.1.p1  ORF type:complete len:446 (-),score=57.17 GDKJ01023405.1:38-1375(-)